MRERQRTVSTLGLLAALACAGCTIESHLACETVADCDDGVFCNGSERCSGGACAPGTPPCTGEGPACADTSCDEDARTCRTILLPSRCDDADACNGVERCDARLGCVATSPPVCDDGLACTTDRCDPIAGCTHDALDEDGDGAAAIACGGSDCLDTPGAGEAARPGLTERCGDGIDNDCDGAIDAAETTCEPTADRCAAASLLPGPGTHVIALREATRDHDVGCFSEWVDVVVLLDVPAPSDLAITSRSIGFAAGGPGTGLALRRADDCAFGPDLVAPQCATETAEGSVSLRAFGVASGRVAIVVAGPADAVVELTVARTDAGAPPPGAACASAIDVSAGGTFDLPFEALVTDAWHIRCGDSGSGDEDRTFVLDLPRPSDVTLSLSPPGTVAISRDCTAFDDALACAAGTAYDRPTVLRRASLPAGRWLVEAEPWRSNEMGLPIDAAALTVEIAPASGSGCGAELDVGAIGGDGSQEILLDPGTVADDVGVPCGPSVPHHLAARFVLTETADVDVSATGEPGALLTLALGTECGARDRTLACSPSSERVGLTRRSLPPGTYHVTIGTDGSLPVALTVLTTPPEPVLAGDRCEGAPPAAATEAVVLSGLHDDGSFVRCLVSRPGVSDIHRTLEITEPTEVRVTATGNVGDGPIGVAIGSADCTRMVDDECAYFDGTISQVHVLDPGRYVVSVESLGASEVLLEIVRTPVVGP